MELVKGIGNLPFVKEREKEVDMGEGERAGPEGRPRVRPLAPAHHPPTGRKPL